jgi:dTDP-4-dehydrorhamnose reductase
MRVLILGASGMLGNAMFRTFSELSEHQVFGTARSTASLRYFRKTLSSNILCGVDVENNDALARLFGEVRPNFVINCIGVVKQLDASDEPMLTIPINSLLPHRLAALCKVASARFVQISTDCVFSGLKGGYVESDFPDADDLYGRSKLLGEVDYPHAITLRTSIIGHELDGNRSLVNWFLSQEGSTLGYSRAVFSGLPAVVLAKLVRDIILPRSDLHGVYHVAAEPISKFDLISLIASVYGKQITIEPDDRLVIDRSLDATRLREETGYVAPVWEELINTMHDFSYTDS